MPEAYSQRVLSAIPDDFVGAGRSIGIWISLLAALLLIAAGLVKSADEAGAAR